MGHTTLPLLALLLVSGFASAAVKPEKVYLAEGKKSDHYIRDGLITGGDQAMNGFVIRDIRRAANQGFERIVIDMESGRSGEAPAIDRPPYYQVSVTPDEKRLVFTLYGKPRLAFDSKKIVAAFKRSAVVDKVLLYPTFDDTFWTFALELKAGRGVEVFELSNPTRVILDIRNN